MTTQPATALIKTVVVDDEPLARTTIVRLLEQDHEVEVSAVCESGLEALETLESVHPDLVFLDIRMPDMDGFAVIEEYRRRHGADALPTIVFVTAFDRFAIRAFEVHAVDYLLKPFGDERFHRALEHTKRQLGGRASGARVDRLLADRREPEAAPPQERFVVRRRGRVGFLDYSEITWFEAADHYVLVHSSSGSHIIRESMQRLESKLDPERFVRIHRSAIVNTDHVVELRPQAHDEIQLALSDGESLRVSRRRYRELKQRLGL